MNRTQQQSTSKYRYTTSTTINTTLWHTHTLRWAGAKIIAMTVKNCLVGAHGEGACAFSLHKTITLPYCCTHDYRSRVDPSSSAGEFLIYARLATFQ